MNLLLLRGTLGELLYAFLWEPQHSLALLDMCTHAHTLGNQFFVSVTNTQGSWLLNSKGFSGHTVFQPKA